MLGMARSWVTCLYSIPGKSLENPWKWSARDICMTPDRCMPAEIDWSIPVCRASSPHPLPLGDVHFKRNHEGEPPECWRIDAFELWCWRRLLRVPWTARRSSQSILKEISPECSLEGLILKLKLQYFGHLMQRTDSFGKTLMLGKIKGGRRGDDRGWDGWMASPTRWTWVSASSGIWWWTGNPVVIQSMGSQRFGHDWATELN